MKKIQQQAVIKIQQTMNIKGFLVPDKRHRNSKANFILNGQPLTFSF